MSIEFTFVPGVGKNAAAFFFDPTAAGRQLALADEAGFERVVVDDPGGMLANFDIAAYAARVSSTLQIVLTHWAGVISPVVAARQLAAFDARTGGRLSLRIPAEGETDRDDTDTLRPGHVAIVQRTDEYLMLLKRLWSNSRPFDFEGRYHSFREGFVPNKGSVGEIPLRMSGNSGTAIQAAARHADVFELSTGPAGDIRQQIERIRNAAVQYGRSEKISFALPVRFNGDANADTPPYGPTGSARGGAAEIAVSFLPYIEAGVSEFMVSGLDDDNAMRLSGDVATILRNTVRRSDAVGFAGWPAIRSQDGVAHDRSATAL
ncbi:MAG: LLM class flavin-dependent oxidoreductase [Mesorhizobium sp.]